MVAIALFASLALLCSAVDAAVWRVPLQRHAVPKPDVIVSPFGPRGPFTDALPSKRSSVWEPEHGPINVEPSADFVYDGHVFYVAEVPVGTPPQPVLLELDAWSTDLVVLNHELPGHEFYDHSKSTSYRANGTRVTLDKGTKYEMDGFLSSDRLSLGRLDIQDQSFMELEKGTSSLFFNESGWVGLGLGRSQLNGGPSFMQSVIAKGLLDRPLVGFQFDDTDAHVTFGGLDPKYTDSDITYIADSDNLTVNGVRVGDKGIIKTSGRGSLLPGWLGPIVAFGSKSQVAALAHAVGAKEDEKFDVHSRYVLPCDGAGPDIVFQIGDVEITLKREHYTFPLGDGSGTCIFGLLPGISDPLWLFFGAFLRRVYMVHDYGTTGSSQRFGIATLKK